ncbi:MAG: sensor histidine kinase [Anaerolineales bacterium]
MDDLIQIRPVWIHTTTLRMAQTDSLREGFGAQLELFYDHLIQAVKSGEPAGLEPLVDEWVHARTLSDLERREISLFPVLKVFWDILYETIQEQLDSQSGMLLVGTVMPLYMHVLEYALLQEMDLRIDHISHELDEARQVLERLDKSKSDFIAIAAHELKTPLTLIEGYASMVAEQISQNPRQAADMLNGIEKGTLRLREIIDDMIDVSLIDNNLLSLNFQPVWVNRLLSMIEQEVLPTLRERKLRLSIEDFAGSQKMFFGDTERLYQAFRNLTLNAIKFTPDGGSISITGRTLPGFIEVTVSDTGIGIAPENHNSIFEKFGRLGSVSLHSSGKTKFKGGGPGLGLPITKGIVEAHGGAIWVESEGYDEVNCPGATFHVLLPTRKEPPDEKIARLFHTQSDTNLGQEILVDKSDPIH